MQEIEYGSIQDINTLSRGSEIKFDVASASKM